MTWLLAWCLWGVDAEPPRPANPPAPLVGSDFAAALERPLTTSWENVELRTILRRLAESQRIAVILDGRLDPTVTVNLAVTDRPLVEVVDQLAARVDGGVGRTASVLYVGPVASSRWLRTAIEQQETGLARSELRIDEARRFELLARHTFAWPELTTPGEQLDALAAHYGLEVRERDAVPHDLRPAMNCPMVTAPEGLALLLSTHDLMVRWEPEGRAITLVPWTPPEPLERRYRPRAKETLAQLTETWRSLDPTCEVAQTGGELVVRARWESHEAFRRARLGSATPSKSPGPTPLRRRKFTLRVENVPIRAVMTELEKSAVTFVWDVTAFTEAGIDLETKVSLNVAGVTADEFLAQLFAPLPVQVTIDDRTVTLTPKAR